MSKEAIEYYEAALKEAFPSGATGDVFHHWNEARKALAEQEPVAYIRKDQLQKAAQSPMLCEVTPEPRQDRIGIHTSLPAQQQEPVAYLFTNVQSGDIEASTDPDWHQCERELWHRDPLYTSPPAPRKPLTDEEIEEMANDFEEGYVFLYRSFARAIEAAHGITKGGAA